MKRYAAKRDKNEPEIIDILQRMGCTVTQLSASGVPDLLAGIDGVNLLLEVKDKKGTLTTDQEDWHKMWIGQKAIVRTCEDAQAIVERIIHASVPRTPPQPKPAHPGARYGVTALLRVRAG